MNYRIRDIELADYGRREIEIAEHEMPGLVSCGRSTAWRNPWEVSG